MKTYSKKLMGKLKYLPILARCGGKMYLYKEYHEFSMVTKAHICCKSVNLMDDLLISGFISSFIPIQTWQIGFLLENWSLEVDAQFKTFSLQDVNTWKPG